MELRSKEGGRGMEEARRTRRRLRSAVMLPSDEGEEEARLRGEGRGRGAILLDCAPLELPQRKEAWRLEGI
jgi:hypothetical protein